MITYWRLEKHSYTPPTIATAAILDCACCGIAIDGMNGPGYDMLCDSCGTKLQKIIVEGRLVEYDDGHLETT